MKKSIITLCLMAITLGANAQTSKNVEYDCIANNMKYAEPVEKKESKLKKVASVAGTILSALAGQADVTTNHPEYADNVMQAITAAIGSTYHFNTVDNASNSNSQLLNIDATISCISTTEHTHVWTDDKKVAHRDLEYNANITGTISLKDAKTGNVVWTKTVNLDGLDWGWVSSAEIALGNAIQNMQYAIASDLNKEFPLYASIVDKGTVKKDKQKEVFIDLGNDDGVEKGMKFYVYEVHNVAGKEAKEQIGMIKVTEVMGDDISNCKVTKGASDLKMALDEGKTLQIMSRG